MLWILLLSIEVCATHLRKAWEQLTPELCGYIALSCSFALALNFLGTFVPQQPISFRAPVKLPCATDRHWRSTSFKSHVKLGFNGATHKAPARSVLLWLVGGFKCFWSSLIFGIMIPNSFYCSGDWNHFLARKSQNNEDFLEALHDLGASAQQIVGKSCAQWSNVSDFMFDHWKQLWGWTPFAWHRYQLPFWENIFQSWWCWEVLSFLGLLRKLPHSMRTEFLWNWGTSNPMAYDYHHFAHLKVI